MNSCGKAYEDYLIDDNNWYTYYEMGKKYPFDKVYCITKRDVTTGRIIYQPKVIVTCNIDVYKKAIVECDKLASDLGESYSTQVFIGGVMSSIQYKAFRV